MAADFSFGFVDCIRNLNCNNANDISDLLQQKYGIEFAVGFIGNRLGSDKIDTVTAFCYPLCNPKIMFKTIMNTNKEIVYDEYPVRILEIEAKDIIEQKFIENGIEATVDVSVTCLTRPFSIINKNLEQVIKDCPNLSLTFTTILSESADPRKLYDVIMYIFSEMYSKNNGIMIGTTIWKYNKESYNSCSLKVNSIPHINSTLLEQFGPLSKTNMAIDKGIINKKFEDFIIEF